MRKIFFSIVCVSFAVMGNAAQCIATTKQGFRCSRKAAVGSAYCWQHMGALQMPMSRIGSYRTERSYGYQPIQPMANVESQRTYVPSQLTCCRAIYACGTRCNRYVKSGEEYCSEHIGYDPNNKPRLKVVKLPQNDKGRLRSTREKLDVVRKCIDYYSDRRGGELPCDLATLMAGNPTYMAPPLKDAWGVPFVVALLDEGLDVRSAGVDGELGNEDDIVLIMER